MNRFDTFITQAHPEELASGCDHNFCDGDCDECLEFEDEPDSFLNDAEADADALASAG